MVSQRKGDGSVEVWLNGWHVRFPANGGEPSVAKGTAPDPPPPGEEAEVSVSSFDSATFVGHGDWIVELGERDFTVTPVEPEDGDDNRRYYVFE